MKKEYINKLKEFNRIYKSDLLDANKASLLYGTVKSVDDENACCSVETLEGYTIDDVAYVVAGLKPNVLLKPQPESLCIVGSIEDAPGQCVLLHCAQYESIEVDIKGGIAFKTQDSKEGDILLQNPQSAVTLHQGEIWIEGEKSSVTLKDKIKIENDMESLKGILNQIVTTIEAFDTKTFFCTSPSSTASIGPMVPTQLTSLTTQINNLFE